MDVNQSSANSLKSSGNISHHFFFDRIQLLPEKDATMISIVVVVLVVCRTTLGFAPSSPISFFTIRDVYYYDDKTTTIHYMVPRYGPKPPPNNNKNNNNNNRNQTTTTTTTSPFGEKHKKSGNARTTRKSSIARSGSTNSFTYTYPYI